MGLPSRSSPPRLLLATLLVLIPLLTVNNFFGYHATGAIGDSLQRYFGLSAEEFGALFTVYSAPNVILVFIGGLWIDRLGVVTTSLIFNVTMLAGMVLFALAPAEPLVDADTGRTHASTHSLVYLLTGRLLLGLGGECLCAAASTMLARWFENSGWLTFACGLNQALVQLLGSAAAFMILPQVMERRTKGTEAGRIEDGPASGLSTDDHGDLGVNVRICLWLTVGVCVVSLLANLAYAAIEKRYGHLLPASSEGAPAITAPSLASLNEGAYLPIREPTSASSSSSVVEVTAWERVSSLSHFFWLILLMHCLLSPILYTFTAFGPLQLMERYGVSEAQAGEWTSLLYIAILLSPFFGAAIDYVGYRAIWQIAASATIPLLLTAMVYTDVSPALLMIGIGSAYAVTESVGISMIALAVPSAATGTAYGLLGCGISIALLFEPYLVGVLKASSGRYDQAALMFILVTTAGALCAVAVAVYDSTHSRKMVTSARALEATDDFPQAETAYQAAAAKTSP